jgi:uncharacterized protein HemY
VAELKPDWAGGCNVSAWLLATAADPKSRDPQAAVRLAQKAVAQAPQTGEFWNTLGVAHYRAGDWNAAVEALEKGMALRNGGDGRDWVFLAMARWKQGHTKEAKEWLDRAVGWMEKNQPTNAVFQRFRAEAEELLGRKAK